MTEPSTSKSVRGYLDEHFKPVFNEYDKDGIPLSELKKLLSDSTLPERQISTIVTTADKDGDHKITYDEFVQQMFSENEATMKKLRIRKRFLNRAVMAIDPSAGRRHQQAVIETRGLDTPDAYNWGEADVDNYIEAYDCRPPPIFIPLITVVEIIVFAFYGITHSLDDDPSNDVSATSGVPIQSPLIYSPYKRHEVWRFLTYMMIHNGYIHLGFNCVFQLVLGTLLELVHKWWRCGLVYLLGVIAGSLLHSISDAYVFLAGASGGCYALIGAHLASICTNWSAMQDKWLSSPVHFFSSGVFRLILIVLLAGTDTGTAIYARWKNPAGRQIGFAAHLGGLFAGFLLGIPILRNLRIERWEKICFWVCITICITLLIIAIVFNAVCDRHNLCPSSIW